MSRRRRAVIATRLYTPEVTAASFRMEALAHALAADSDVTVLSTKPPRGTVIADAPGVGVRRAPARRARSGAIPGYIPYLSFDVPLFFRLLVRRSDVVVAEAPPTTGFAAAIAAFLTRRPLVYYPGDVWTDAVASMDAPGPVVAVMRFVERFVLRRAARSRPVSNGGTDRPVAIGGRPPRGGTGGSSLTSSSTRSLCFPTRTSSSASSARERWRRS